MRTPALPSIPPLYRRNHMDRAGGENPTLVGKSSRRSTRGTADPDVLLLAAPAGRPPSRSPSRPPSEGSGRRHRAGTGPFAFVLHHRDSRTGEAGREGRGGGREEGREGGREGGREERYLGRRCAAQAAAHRPVLVYTDVGRV